MLMSTWAAFVLAQAAARMVAVAAAAATLAAAKMQRKCCLECWMLWMHDLSCGNDRAGAEIPEMMLMTAVECIETTVVAEDSEEVQWPGSGGQIQ